MKFYLSSYRLGSESAKLLALLPPSKQRMLIIPNARDNDMASRPAREERESQALQELGIETAILDLQDYFGHAEELEKLIAQFGGLWVLGGNTFVLRQAMKLSGLDILFQKMHADNSDFLYAGYSAGCCVLAPTLRGLDIVDDPRLKPYGDYETIWEGLNLIPYSIAPHYKSEHPESAEVDREVDYLEKNNLPYKTLRDGEVLLIV
jgi:dipeptidase E